MTFRSILPHEPLPSNDENGFIHLQGAFAPKKRHQLLPCDEDDDGSSYWTRQSLEETLQLFFSTNIEPPSIAVEVLDGAPPFTKVRLSYETTRHAQAALAFIKRKNLFPGKVLTSNNDTYAFTSRQFQATQITTTPLLQLEDQVWTRSNPPKFKRLQIGDDPARLQQERAETRYVVLSNLLPAAANSNISSFWKEHDFCAEAIRSVVNQFDTSGHGAEVFCGRSEKLNRSCHVGMRSSHDATALVQGLHEHVVTWTFTDYQGVTHVQPSGTLFVEYASLKFRQKPVCTPEPTRPTCTSTTQHVTVPGLLVIEDFVTPDQEQALMAVLTGPHAPWAPAQVVSSETGSVKRKVQHYGYVFDYKTADVLRDRTIPGADCPPMPALSENNAQVVENDVNSRETYNQECVDKGDGWGLLAGIVEKTRRWEFPIHISGKPRRRVYGDLNQLTVNRYAPGEGIGSHVDTPSAFSEGLISISLNSGIVMEFRKVNVVDGEDSKKLVYLPRRSLVLMSGPARYEWQHMIVTRSTDTVNGQVLQRNLRISLTLRTAIDEMEHPMPLVESNQWPPTWGASAEPGALITPACERDHVHAIYDAVATQWHHTRGRRGVLWPGATQFLQRLEPGSIVADVGCGDGKYFSAIIEAGSYVIGTDISRPLLMTAFSPDDQADTRRVSDERRHFLDRPDVCVADCMNVPLRTNSCDAAICIAVLHHLSTTRRRLRCLNELVRIVRPGGTINVQAWALEQRDDSRRKFAANDIFVPFNAQPKYLKLNEQQVDDIDAAPTMNSNPTNKSTAQVYSEQFNNADYDDRKGLVVFQRYCHLYKLGEMEELVAQVPNAELIDAGFEAGNYFVILKVLK
jgi:alkylated DNA repair dioxygenase AlkB/SAM-dependent methyltransferase